MNFNLLNQFIVPASMRPGARLAAAVLALLAACAGPSHPRPREPTLAEWQGADFGSKPTDYIRTIRNYLAGIPKDLNDMTIRFKRDPERTWVGNVPNFQYGYGICAELSERAVDIDHVSFGPTFFFIENGEVAQMEEGSQARRLCNRIGLIPNGQKISRDASQK